jgi:hypothetical protein
MLALRRLIDGGSKLGLNEFEPRGYYGHGERDLAGLLSAPALSIEEVAASF